MRWQKPAYKKLKWAKRFAHFLNILVYMSKTDFYKIGIKFLLVCITGSIVNYANSFLVSQDMLANF
jgi:hypothetical protein